MFFCITLILIFYYSTAISKNITLKPKEPEKKVETKKVDKSKPLYNNKVLENIDKFHISG